jgi:hypothetical protein
VTARGLAMEALADGSGLLLGGLLVLYGGWLALGVGAEALQLAVGLLVAGVR